MEKSGTCACSTGPCLGGVLAGLGIGAILLAALEQFTNRNLENYTILTVSLGLAAIAAGAAWACRARRRTQ